MLFPDNAQQEICENKTCPHNANRIFDRSKAVCIKKQSDNYIVVNSESPSILILFRDPKIEIERNVPYVLDLKYAPNEKVSSRLFSSYKTHLLNYFPDGEIIYLDNFIRCQCPNVSRSELSKNFWNYSNRPAIYCVEITKILIGEFNNLKCLIFSDTKLFEWFRNNGLLHFLDQETEDFLSSGRGKSPVLLNKCFNVEGWNFPVFFFPHPNTLLRQYWRFYAPGKPYHSEFMDGRAKILSIL